MQLIILESLHGAFYGISIDYQSQGSEHAISIPNDGFNLTVHHIQLSNCTIEKSYGYCKMHSCTYTGVLEIVTCSFSLPLFNLDCLGTDPAMISVAKK